MKVLIINTVPFNRNGITSVIMNYYRQLKNDVDFDFIANSDVSNEFKNEIEKSNSKLYFFKSRKKQPIMYINYVKRIVKKNRYDIVHIHGNSSLMSLELIAVGNSAKTIVHGHNVTTDYPLLHKFLYPYFMKHHDYAFVPSKESGDWLFKKGNYHVISNGIEISNFEFRDSVRNIHRKDLDLVSKRVILNVSNFSSPKKQSLLIELLPALLKEDDNFHILFVGDGKEIENQKNKVVELGVQANVTFLGSREDANQLYSAADYFAFPTNWESLGLVAVEAQANGLPVVISDTVPKIVKIHNNVKFISNNSPELWIEFFLKEKRKNKVSLNEFNNFDIKLNSLRLKQMYEKILNQKSKKNERNNNEDY